MIEYRKWKYEDILAISELEKQIFKDDPWSYQIFADGFEREFFFVVVAVENDEIIGYACLSSVFENADVENLAVDENYRGQGIGAELLRRLEAEAKNRGAQKAMLEARVSNVPALRLYLKSGYVGLYARTRYYPNGEDAIVMQKNLV